MEQKLTTLDLKSKEILGKLLMKDMLTKRAKRPHGSNKVNFFHTTNQSPIRE